MAPECEDMSLMIGLIWGGGRGVYNCMVSHEYV